MKEIIYLKLTGLTPVSSKRPSSCSFSLPETVRAENQKDEIKKTHGLK